MVPPTQLPLGSRASNRLSPATSGCWHGCPGAIGNGTSHPIAPGQPCQQPLVAGDREQLLRRLRQLGLKVGDAHARAIAVLHGTTLLSPPKKKTTASYPMR